MVHVLPCDALQRHRSCDTYPRISPVFPNFGSLGGIGDISTVIGAMLTAILTVAVLMLIVCAIIWATAASTGNPGLSSKGRTGVHVAVGAAALAGAGVAWINWLVNLGGQL